MLSVPLSRACFRRLTKYCWAAFKDVKSSLPIPLVGGGGFFGFWGEEKTRGNLGQQHVSYISVTHSNIYNVKDRKPKQREGGAGKKMYYLKRITYYWPRHPSEGLDKSEITCSSPPFHITLNIKTILSVSTTNLHYMRQNLFLFDHLGSQRHYDDHPPLVSWQEMTGVQTVRRLSCVYFFVFHLLPFTQSWSFLDRISTPLHWRSLGPQ